MTVAMEALAGRSLAPREFEVLGLVARGMSNEEIAAELFLSVDTVKTHVRRLLAKLGAVDRTHAVALGFERGLLLTDAGREVRARLAAAQGLLACAREVLSVVPRCRWHGEAVEGLGECSECERWLSAQRVRQGAVELLRGGGGV